MPTTSRALADHFVSDPRYDPLTDGTAIPEREPGPRRRIDRCLISPEPQDHRDLLSAGMQRRATDDIDHRSDHHVFPTSLKRVEGEHERTGACRQSIAEPARARGQQAYPGLSGRRTPDHGTGPWVVTSVM